MQRCSCMCVWGALPWKEFRGEGGGGGGLDGAPEAMLLSDYTSSSKIVDPIFK